MPADDSNLQLRLDNMEQRIKIDTRDQIDSVKQDIDKREKHARGNRETLGATVGRHESDILQMQKDMLAVQTALGEGNDGWVRKRFESVTDRMTTVVNTNYGLIATIAVAIIVAVATKLLNV